MKIGIVTSWFEMIPLFKLLNRFNYHYIIYRDWNSWPYWDKDFDFVLEKVSKWIEVLKEYNVDLILLPPTLEIYFLWKDNLIYPFFKKYVLYCLNYSLVWKIWFVWDWLDKQIFQGLFYDKILPNYILNERQKNIRKFNKKFPIWIKEVSMWKYYLVQFWSRDRMVRKTIKFDLRYFKDADVDTLIPLNWWYLAFDNILRKYLKFKRIRYHSLSLLEKFWFENIWDIFNKKFSSLYKVAIIPNWSVEFLTRQKRRMRLLQRWKEVKLEIWK
jgi:hypothetical protein